MDTLKGNRRRAKMTAATITKELAAAPAPHPSDLVPLDMVAVEPLADWELELMNASDRLDGGAAPLRATSHVSGYKGE